MPITTTRTRNISHGRAISRKGEKPGERGIRTYILNREPRMSARARRRLAKARKAELKTSGHTILDVARLADRSYTMAQLWVSGRRNSAACEAAFTTLTAKSA